MIEAIWPVSKVLDDGHPSSFTPFHAPSQQNPHSVTGPFGIPRHRQTADIADDPKNSLGNPKLSKDRLDACKHPSDLKAPHLDREARSNIRHLAEPTRPYTGDGLSREWPASRYTRLLPSRDRRSMRQAHFRHPSPFLQSIGLVSRANRPDRYLVGSSAPVHYLISK